MIRLTPLAVSSARQCWGIDPQQAQQAIEHVITHGAATPSEHGSVTHRLTLIDGEEWAVRVRNGEALRCTTTLNAGRAV